MASPTMDKQPWVLVTNDDGPDSPALLPLLRGLSAAMRVRALVPSREYSWSGKTLTRQGTVRVEEKARTDGYVLSTLTGSPADCANLGIHHLDESKPSMVVSGVNMGSNAGLSFMLSSGTVGAAIEAALGGVAAAAFSVELPPDVYKKWRTERSLDAMDGLWTTTATITREVCQEILRGGLPGDASVLSVNMPPTCEVTTPRRFARVTPTAYGSFFERLDDDTFDHHYDGLRVLGGDGQGDVEVLERGEVALTPIPLNFDPGEVTPGDRRRFGRTPSTV